MILGIDFETTGLDVRTCEVTEIGAVLWDETTSRPVVVENMLIKGPQLSAEIQELTGIRQSHLDTFGIPLETALHARLAPLIDAATYLVAHNAAGFDRLILERLLPYAVGKPWIDTRTDLPLPPYIKQRSLGPLAVEHEFLNPFSHRAAFDALTMLKILSKYDFAEVCRRAAEPKVDVFAMVSFEQKDLARARGYHWNPDWRKWSKIMLASEVESEQRDAGFKVVVKPGAV